MCSSQHVLQIHAVWSVSDFLNPNQSQTMEFRFPLFGSASWGSASVSASVVTLLVIVIFVFHCTLLRLCLLPSDRCHKRVLAGDEKMLPQSTSAGAVTSAFMQ